MNKPQFFVDPAIKKLNEKDLIDALAKAIDNDPIVRHYATAYEKGMCNWETALVYMIVGLSTKNTELLVSMTKHAQVCGGKF